MEPNPAYQKWRRETKKALALGQAAPPRPADAIDPQDLVVTSAAMVPCCHVCGENRLQVLVMYKGHPHCGNCVVMAKQDNRRGLMKILDSHEVAAPPTIRCPRCKGEAMLRPGVDPPQYLCLGQGTPSNCYFQWTNEPKTHTEESQ